ncbi:MAG: V-type ATP synthase subunit E [Acutalibacteraceae bacterium]
MATTEEKTGNFLSAIQKYADEQKHRIESEVERFKKEELKKAEDEGLKDAYTLIQKEMASMRTGITSEIAKREEEGKQKLYKKRMEITEKVFSQAFAKLAAYSETDEYKERIKKDAAELAEFFKGEDCTVYIKPGDDGLKGDISACFAGCNISLQTSDKIKIGGLAVFCEKRGIYADQTLDTKLKDRKDWFLQNSGLKIR